MGGFAWKKGYIKTAEDGGKTKILVVNAIIPPAQKSLNETQGQVTADYQNFLDKQWIDTLRAKYQVSINRDVLQLVK
jgi:peptidyl-prolyl cis-trans isomerase SurA